LKRLAITASLAALSLMASASPAAASITIGQVADPTAGNCDAGTDFVQLGVTSGNPYVVPGNGTITSWTVQAGDSSGELTMKVFRKLADPARFQVVGHAGPQRLTPGGTAGNTFPANVRVRSGDLLGLHSAFSPCAFKDQGGQFAVFSGDLADGAAANFGPENGISLDIQAVFVPDNTFSLGGTTRNKKKGTATVTVNVPNPGELSLSGKGIKTRAATSIPSAGKAELRVMAKGRTIRKLRESGKARVTARITYTPTGGDPSTRSMALKLKRL
jgi:hypothetical protein